MCSARKSIAVTHHYVAAGARVVRASLASVSYGTPPMYLIWYALRLPMYLIWTPSTCALFGTPIDRWYPPISAYALCRALVV